LVKEHLHPDLEVLGAVLTLFDRRVKVAHDVVKEVREHFPGHVFDTVIPRNIRLAEAPSYGKNIFEYDDESQGAQTYQLFADEVHRSATELINPQI
jgi:chromosome partitioning protein